MLEIGFSIQVFGFNVTYALRSTGIEQHQVSWKVFVLVDLQDLSHLDLSPFDFCEDFILALLVRVERDCERWSVVFALVLLHSHEMLEQIFDHGHEDDKSQWHGDGRLPSRVRYLRNQLQYHHDEEVYVTHLRELVHQVLGHKVPTSILARVDLVAWISRSRLLALTCGGDLVDEQVSEFELPDH